MTVLAKIKNLLSKFNKDDPMKSCETYLNEGCAFVDGIGCNFPNCPFQGGAKISFGYEEVFKD